ncbi:MAG: carboxypeptidase M32 [Phycisphaerales bacterium JB043]
MTTTQTDVATSNKAYSELCSILREIGNLHSIDALLNWDTEVLMPDGASKARAEQTALIAGLKHERKTSSRFADLLAECESDADLANDPMEGRNLREIRRDFDKATKLSTELVSEISRVTSEGVMTWRDARASNDFEAFAPSLERIFELMREKASAYGVPEGGELYDALFADYEVGMRVSEVEAAFTPLRAWLKDFVREVRENGTPIDESFRGISLPVDKQVEFNRMLGERLGFDYSCGRLDVSTHPFSEPIGPGDIRMTTRYKEDAFLEGLLATMHETGHSLYEQQIDKWDRLGQPLAEAISLGVHESQSRVIENQVGRSRAFWEWALPAMHEYFGDASRAFSVEQAWWAANRVKPSFIRVEADETTYGLHIMMRFDIERLLVDGKLSVRDVPEWWNARMKEDFGVDVDCAANGCLQDIHWSAGYVGYFPTYYLGTLYSAQMWEVFLRDHPGAESEFAQGEFGSVVSWMGEHVHRHGRRDTTGEMLQRICGEGLNPRPFQEYLEAKIRGVYGL